MRALGRKVAVGAVRALRRTLDVKRESARIALGILLGAAIPLAMVMACSDERVRTPIVGGGDNTAGGPGIPDPCANPNEGCACDDEGAEVDCGQLREQFDDYVTCQMGTRTCTDGAWSACAGDRVTVKSTGIGSPGLGTRALGSAQVCPKDGGPELNPCDPYCNVTPDTPTGWDAGPNFTNDGGLTIIETGDGGVPCTTLTLTPTPAKVTAPDIVTVSAFGPPPVTSPAGPVTFILTAGPMGCTTPMPFATTWVINRVDRAQITGTNNTNGQLTIAVPLAGPIQVTAYALGTSATTTINVKVNVVEAPTTTIASDPNTPAPAASINSFSTVANACAPTVTANCRNSPNVPATASTAHWLYPYTDTYLPLGLPAPWLQYLYDAVSSGGTVKASLRYPTGLAATDTGTLFNYSLIVAEANGAAVKYGGTSVTANTLDPQVVIPQTAWQYFEQTARGQNADLLVQRLSGSGTLETEIRRRIHFVDGQLKGTVFYATYNSKLAGAGNTGAILKIAPGAVTPTLAVQPSGRCTACHSVNLDGSSLIANTDAGPTGWVINESRRYNITTAGPSPAVLNDYAGAQNVPATGTTTAVTQLPTGGPAVTMTGTPAEDGTGRIVITTGGARGTAVFRWDYGGLQTTSVGTMVTTAATVALGTTGMTAGFPTGTYVLNTVYEWRGAKAAPSVAGEYYAHTLGDRYTFGAPRTDGSFYMTHGGRATGSVGVGDPNFRAPPDYSGLFAVDPDSARNTPVPVTGWPTDMLAVTPKFSPDGTKLAFGFWGGSPLAQAPSGSLTQVSGGTRLAVTDFSLSCTAPPCTSATEAGLAASVANARNLTPGVKQRVAWPTFTPSGNAVIYQRQFRTSKSRVENQVPVKSNAASPTVTITGTPNFPAPAFDDTGLITINLTGMRGAATFNWTFAGESGTGVLTAATVTLGTTGLTANFPTGTYTITNTYTWNGSELGTIGGPGWGQWNGWSPSHINSSAGALAELWLSGVPADSFTAAVPTRLNALNGLTGAGASYLPTASRLAAPAQNTYHAPNASFGITQSDLCGNTGTATGINDYQLNYLPAVNPIELGGFVWVVFTSRRMFGNVAYNDPWDAEAATCASGVPPAKKLWIAAINPNVTSGTDPSHPAFYLPGQELRAGNANGYWVNSPCAMLNSSCVTNDDCCNGTGASPTVECKVTSSATVPPTKACQNISACSMTGAACAVTADCCAGLTCPMGGGVCITEPVPPATVFMSQSTTREYVADCPHGTQVKWRHFEWQATLPTTTSIVFSVQTKTLATDPYLPAMPVFLSTANATNTLNPTTWYHGQTVDQALASAMPAALPSRNYLRVTMTFNPTMTEAPVLHQWRQIFDCMPAE